MTWWNAEAQPNGKIREHSIATGKEAMRDLLFAVCGLVVAGLLGVIVFQNYQRFHKPQLTTTYQAVTLLSGEVIYGRIDHLGTDHPVLRDAFGICTEADAQTGLNKHTLVRRKDGPSGADHVIVPATAIAAVEPLQPESAIGKLMQEAGMRP